MKEKTKSVLILIIFLALVAADICFLIMGFSVIQIISLTLFIIVNDIILFLCLERIFNKKKGIK